VEQLRRLEQENQEHQKTIELLKKEVHRKEQRFWEEEANSPPSASLLRTYETQKELFLFLYDYRSGQKLSKLEFEELWHRVEVVGKENLLVEMLCRDILKLSDPLAAVILMGDVGARVTMYYMELELRIREKRGKEMRPTSLRVIHFKDYGSDFYRIKREGILMWCNMMMNYSQQQSMWIGDWTLDSSVARKAAEDPTKTMDSSWRMTLVFSVQSFAKDDKEAKKGAM
jgi:hypothetical protein